MAKYEPGDTVTYYFILRDDDDKVIKAWTDKKKLAEFYMEFHNCPSYVLKTVTKTIEEIVAITEENLHDEINIVNLYTRKNNKGDGKLITIPATELEATIIREEANTFFQTKIDYGLLNEAISFLKPRYRKAFDRIFLSSIIRYVIHNKHDAITQQINLDQLMVLIKSFPNDFG